MPYCGEPRQVCRHEGWSGPGLYDGSLNRGVGITYLATEDLGPCLLHSRKMSYLARNNVPLGRCCGPRHPVLSGPERAHEMRHKRRQIE